ncbi:helix-turn-helix domain-containing protein [Flavobacterium sp. Fl-318]|uniref:Helix-turn-helix domain-containing protein n=1 Tax=Flavobacterium cupriresistens TaxID=2893885 RepID=A0ABU4RC86_9FLAO|nr:MULTISPECIES: helix-turn-helix domain-containing protein [unclassified Flavobacterium]MDX6190206.1 helix-turn-helix domain-containing protein [Flavobacterium sp. Fl-318]UFH43024.1 helix-turn-helix domain containing protein [Flavobacterium sp. F-323]
MIINEIKKHLGFKKDIDFASYLGINQSTLSSWHKRGSINYELIITKCKDIDANWLLTGKGQMLRKNNKESLNEQKTMFKEELNCQEVELLKKDLKTAQSTLKDKNQMLEVQNKYIGKLEQEIESLKSKKNQ